MGEPPDWYSRLQIARYLGVAPWELDEVSIAWSHWAASAMNMEAQAAKNKHER